MNQFENDNPERFFQVGIAEANMIGIAAGLTIGGKIPYTGTFANFSTSRVYDQIRQSIAHFDQSKPLILKIPFKIKSTGRPPRLLRFRGRFRGHRGQNFKII